MKYKERIVTNPQIMHGKPVVKGTRIPVYIVLNLMASGLDTKGILEEYPDLTKEDVLACLEYASHLAQEEVGVIEADEIA